MTAPIAIRQYEMSARSTDTFGRVLCSARNHHFVVDGPVQNGCPGEALTPPEVFLSGVAACGVELIQVIAREQQLSVDYVSATARAVVDRSRQSRPDVTTFNRVELDFVLRGTDHVTATTLVEGFKRR